MNNNVQEYLDSLKRELKGSDSATIQDALSDAEEHLRTALNALKEEKPDAKEDEMLSVIIEEYGSPGEVAAAYKTIEARVLPTLAYAHPRQEGSFWSRFFGVVADPRAWGAVLYMILSLATGIIYFTWATTGITTSLGVIFLIIGIPFAILFLISVRGLALLEGRLVEALLGVRMPRRPLFYDRNLGWVARLKKLISDGHTWLSILYLVLQLPLGLIYFTLVVTLLSLSLGLIASPVIQAIVGHPVIQLGYEPYFIPWWGQPFIMAFGALLGVVSLHLVKWVGMLHGKYAKWILVRD